MGNWWSDLLRNILGFFDSIIYGFIDNVYNTFTNIANYTLLNTNMLDTFMKRIYILIGVFMLFKMAFSLITYFIDPDKLTDSKSGFGNLVQRIIISLVLLVLTPTLFNIAFYGQTIVLKENILANIILGGEYANVDSSEFVDTYENAGKKMAFSVLSAFMAPKDTSVISMTEKEVEKEFDGEDDEIESYKLYLQARDNNSINALVGWNGIKNNEDANGEYLYNYTAGLSTIAGVVVLLVLLTFCVEVGVRAVKLVFLQLIAPIPILSYIDANKGKSVFDKWLKECIGTYLDVFVRLIAIYFAIFIITLITQNGFTVYTYALDSTKGIVTKEVNDVDLFAQALIIIGLLIFAGELPKLLEDMLGVKFSGKFTLNPLKRIGSSPIAAGVLGGAVGFGAGMLSNTSNLVKNMKDKGIKETFLGNGKHIDKNGNEVPDGKFDTFKKIARTAGSPLAATAGTRAMIKGFTGGGKGSIWKNVQSGLKDSNDSRYKRSQYIGAGYGVGQRASDKFDEFIGYKNKYAGVGRMDDDLQKLRNKAAEYDTRENRAREQMLDFESKYSNQYGAETFDVGFKRDTEGKLAFQSDEYSGPDDYSKYLKYMEEVNSTRKSNEQIIPIAEKDVFEQYSNLEQNVNYYNKEHEEIKKSIKQKEKIVNTRKKNKE